MFVQKLYAKNPDRIKTILKNILDERCAELELGYHDNNEMDFELTYVDNIPYHITVTDYEIKRIDSKGEYFGNIDECHLWIKAIRKELKAISKVSEDKYIQMFEEIRIKQKEEMISQFDRNTKILIDGKGLEDLFHHDRVIKL